MLDIRNLSITTLSENSVADINYVAEWGLSIYLSTGTGLDILFDAGYGDACVHNAHVAGVRLSEIGFIALSHGHTDHTGGLRFVLRQINFEKPNRKHVDIFCHPAAIKPQHVRHTSEFFFRGCPYALEELKSLGARFKTSSKPVWLTKDIVLSGEIPMATGFERIAPICFLKKKGKYVSSMEEDDQALFLRTSKGLLIILGCAHRGIINTIAHAKTLTGMDKIVLVIGGTHLMNTSREQQKKTLEALKAFDVQKIGVSHCTGMRPAAYLASQLGDKRFFFNNAGTRITFPNGNTRIDAFEKHDL
jgi:7,8-dihydropterin-6-yl-methyl-4-(beta-D-ribofuranosyl)aminobenzene 5'-phosphate synthase